MCVISYAEAWSKLMHVYGKEYFVQQYKLLVVNSLKSAKIFKLSKMNNIGKL